VLKIIRAFYRGYFKLDIQVVEGFSVGFEVNVKLYVLMEFWLYSDFLITLTKISVETN